MERCRKCQSPVGPADASRRYCPYCGTARIIPDPPDSGLQGGLLHVGRDVIGPHTGTVYGYFQAGDAPVPLDSLSGPFQRDGSPVRDLFGASGTPLPQRAWSAFCRDGQPQVGAIQVMGNWL